MLWPPTGLLVAALLLAPGRRRPLVVVAALPAALLAALVRGLAPELAIASFAGTAADAVLAAWLVLRVAGPRPSPATVRGALALALLPAVAGAAVSLAARAASLLVGVAGSGAGAWVAWAGSALGAAIIAPLLLAFAAEPPPHRVGGRTVGELAALAAAAALGLAAFARYGATPWPHEVVLVPALVWAALRFGVRGATAVLAVTAVAVAKLHPPDPTPVPTASAQVFLAMIAVTVLLVAAATEERRRAAADLARSRDLLQSFFAQSPVGMYLEDERHRPRVVSRSVAELVGARPEDLIGRRVHELLAAAPSGEEMIALESAALAGGAPLQKEIRHGERTFLHVVFPIPRAEGPPFVGGFALEVTDRVRAETALRASEERLRLVEAALDQASDAVWVVDEDATVVWANSARARLAGIGKERLLGASLLSLVPGLDAEAWRRRWDETRARGVVVREEALPTADGRLVPAEVASAVVEVSGRRCFVSSARDVSDRRRAEAAARLAGIGTLAAGVAHEINNPLAYVLSNLAWLDEQLAAPDARPLPPDEARRVLAEAQRGAARVRDIVQHLRLFARADETIEPVDLVAAARSAITLAENEIRHRAALVTCYADVPPVLGNQNLIAQVFLNLLTNAAHAIPAGRADREAITVDIRAGDGGAEVIAEVSDTGRGIPPELRARIFEPFFTTKAVGEGTGLGLFACHGIVSRMGGRIEVESAPGAGSTFRLVLPATSAAAADAAGTGRAAPAQDRPVRRGRVLVLDDDSLVAAALQRVLQRAHDVEISTDPRAALERVRGGAAWDVVFCDLMMPRMTGMEWFEEVSRAAPHLVPRIVFVTGGAFTAAAREFLERVPNARVEKPFTPEEIRALVAERLGG